MIYLSWAAAFEGPSDLAYFEVLIPRLLEELLRVEGIGSSPDIPTQPSVLFDRSDPEAFATKACADRDSFHLVFLHADTGGRHVSNSLRQRTITYCQAMARVCDWPPERCITITPRHETEAWVLADAKAILDALDYAGSADEIGLPLDAGAAERLPDPKKVLRDAVNQVRGPRRRRADASYLFAAIAQRQSFDALRRAASFTVFEDGLRGALIDLGCIPRRR